MSPPPCSRKESHYTRLPRRFFRGRVSTETSTPPYNLHQLPTDTTFVAHLNISIFQKERKRWATRQVKSQEVLCSMYNMSFSSSFVTDSYLPAPSSTTQALRRSSMQFLSCSVFRSNLWEHNRMAVASGIASSSAMSTTMSSACWPLRRTMSSTKASSSRAASCASNPITQTPSRARSMFDIIKSLANFLLTVLILSAF